jgi:hypothetical protein
MKAGGMPVAETPSQDVPVEDSENATAEASGPHEVLNTPHKMKKFDNSSFLSAQGDFTPGAYSRFVTDWPLVSMFLIFVVLGAFVGIVRIPGYFAILEGNNARTNLEAEVDDAFSIATGWARRNMSQDMFGTSQEAAPVVEEPFTRVRIPTCEDVRPAPSPGAASAHGAIGNARCRVVCARACDPVPAGAGVTGAGGISCRRLAGRQLRSTSTASRATSSLRKTSRRAQARHPRRDA